MEKDRNRRGGLPVLSINGVKLCQLYMRKGLCPLENCNLIHLAKENRPPCPNFASCGVCKFTTDCWYYLIIVFHLCVFLISQNNRYPHPRTLRSVLPNICIQVLVSCTVSFKVALKTLSGQFGSAMALITRGW